VYRKQVRRRRAVLALLIVGSFALLTITYGRGSNGLQRGVSTIFSPVQGVADRALKPARDLVDWFDETFDAKGENSRLKSQLVKVRAQAVAGQEAMHEHAPLRTLLPPPQGPVLAASAYEPVVGRVIARSPTLWRSSVTIDVGSGDGVDVDDPVISGDGVVGRIAAAESGSSQVMLLTDHASAISAKVLPAGVQGVVKPEVGDPEHLILDFIDSTKLVHGGQTVVTAGWCAQGLCSLFPPGLPLGEVTKASIVDQEAKEQADVRPFADIRNLDLVQVLTGGSRG
jgi:rod shape-determining protein MreC